MKVIAAIEPACADACLRCTQTGDLPIPVPLLISRGLGAGLPCLAPPSLRIRKDPEDLA